MMRFHHEPSFLALAVLGLGLALAPREACADRGLSTTRELPPRDRGGAIAGAKIGALVPQPFVPQLDASYFVELEAGYLLPFARRLVSITASAGFTSPESSGGGQDPRLPGGSYNYSLTQQQLHFGLTVAAKIPLGRVVPYLGIGPRLFLLRTLTQGSAGGVPIPESQETSTQIGLGLPIGLDVLLGPGRLFAEGQLLWSPVAQRSTGESSVGSLVLCAGYRLVL